MALSYVEYVGTAGGTTGPFSYGSVALLDADTEPISTQIRVYKNGVVLTFTTDYTINTVLKEVTLVANLFNTDTLRVVRETRDYSRYVDYVDATNVTSQLLDLDSNQLFFLVQEAIDLQSDAMIKGVDGNWQGDGRRITNVATAVNGTDVVNLNQLQAAVTGALPATLSGIGTLTHVGDGTTTSFALPAAIASISSPDDVEVYINGLRQRPTTHYTLSSGNVVITPAPLATDNILLAYPEGTVSAQLTANSVQTASIQDDAVTVAKILQGSNGQVLATTGGNTAWTTIDATYVSNFDVQVRTNRLNQLASATGNYSMGSNRILGLAAPINGDDAVNANYVQGYQWSSSGTYTQTGTTTSVTTTISSLPFTVGSFTFNIPLNLPGPISRYLTGTASFTGNTTQVFNLSTTAGSASWDVTVTRNSATSVTVSAVRVSGSGSPCEFVVGGTGLYTITRGAS